MSAPAPRPSPLPRYSQRSLPPYRHVPGKTPHPERDPKGHMFGRTEVVPQGWNAERWRDNDLYRYGVDLFNRAYWWEAHAAWEALWQTCGKDATAGRFLQALIQIAAALVQDRGGRPDGARRLAAKGLAKLRALSEELAPVASGRTVVYMGVDVEGLIAATERFFAPNADEGVGPPVLVLS